MFTSEAQVRVRYAETDQMGYVYYGNYATYYEVARIECLRHLGFSYKKLEAQGIMMPVLECHSKYIKAGKYDDLLTIKVKIPEFPLVKIRFEYDIYNESGELINQGETILVFVNQETGRPCKMPEKMIELFKPFFDV